MGTGVLRTEQGPEKGNEGLEEGRISLKLHSGPGTQRMLLKCVARGSRDEWALPSLSLL